MFLTNSCFKVLYGIVSNVEKLKASQSMGRLLLIDWSKSWFESGQSSGTFSLRLCGGGEWRKNAEKHSCLWATRTKTYLRPRAKRESAACRVKFQQQHQSASVVWVIGVCNYSLEGFYVFIMRARCSRSLWAPGRGRRCARGRHELGPLHQFHCNNSGWSPAKSPLSLHRAHRCIII